MNLSPQRPAEQQSGLQAPGFLVQMGIGTINGSGVGTGHHFGRNVGMQVQRHDDGHIRPHHFPHPPSHLAVSVGEFLGHRGPVQCQIEAVHGHGRLQSLDRLIRDGVEGLPNYGATRHGEGRHKRNGLDAVGFGPVQKTAQFVIASRPALNQFTAPGQADLLKVLVGGRGDCKGIGFVDKSHNTNAFHQMYASLSS